MVDVELIDAIRNEFRNEFSSYKNEMNTRFDSLDKRVTSLENICTVMEKEHGEKLDLLLDYASANIEKHEEYDNSLKYMDSKLVDHDIRLAVIESTTPYKKSVKTKKNLKPAIQ